MLPAPAAAVGEKKRFVVLGVCEGMGPRVVRRCPRPEPKPAAVRDGEESSVYL